MPLHEPLPVDIKIQRNLIKLRPQLQSPLSNTANVDFITIKEVIESYLKGAKVAEAAYSRSPIIDSAKF